MALIKSYVVVMAVICLYLIDDLDAFCCNGEGEGLVKRHCPLAQKKCDDGSCVSITRCCGLGACNIFCCNCAGAGCRGSGGSSSTSFITEALSKAGQAIGGDVPEKRQSAKEVFDLIDGDGDGRISLDEAADHLSNKLTGTNRIAKRYASDMKFFEDLDSDNSGYIEEPEFDADLE